MEKNANKINAKDKNVLFQPKRTEKNINRKTPERSGNTKQENVRENLSKPIYAKSL